MLVFTAYVSMLLHSSIKVQIEQNAVKFKMAPRKHESILNIFVLPITRSPLIIWFLRHWATVMTACFMAHSHRLSTLLLCSGIAPKKNDIYDVDNNRIENCSVTEHLLYNRNRNWSPALTFYLYSWRKSAS